MCELSHVARLVELGWIDFVDSIFGHFLLCAIVALDKQIAAWQLLDDPPANEGSLGISEPDIALAREVVFALDDAGGLGRVGVILGDELGREGSDRDAEAVRVGAQTCRAHRGTVEMCEGLVARVGHAGLRVGKRRGEDWAGRAVLGSC
jgi:hypothetical protein